MPNYNKQKIYFENLLRQGNLSHAYLFTGPDSTGKNIFAESICTLLTGRGFENNPDLLLIAPDTEKDDQKIYIENARNLKSWMSLKSYSGGYKVVVICDADTMTTEAANAMLKVIEEPPSKSLFILISSKPRLLPSTIISRCETVVFPPVPEIQTKEKLFAIEDLRKVARKNMAERIKYAKDIYEKEDYAALVDTWLHSLRFQLASKPLSAPVLKRLLHLSRIVSQPQYNHRIALEHFFVNLS